MNAVFLFVYRQPIPLICFLMALAVVVCAFVRLFLNKKNEWKKCFSILTVLYIIFLFIATVLSRSPGIFDVFLHPFSALQRAKQQPEIYREMLMNVLLFEPLGLLFSLSVPFNKRVILYLLFFIFCGSVIGCNIEYMQYTFMLGSAETDDILCNTLGVFIGLSAIPCSVFIQKKERLHNEQ